MEQDQGTLPAPAELTSQAQAVFSWPKLLVNMLVLPALVVAGLVGVVIGLRWLTAAEDDVPALVERIAQRGEERWSAAMLLALRLSAPDAAHLRRDAALAERVGALLRQQLRSRPGTAEDFRVCYYLCHALGRFEIAAPMPALLEAVEAAGAERRSHPAGPESASQAASRSKLPGGQPPETEGQVAVSCAALEAIAQLAARLEPDKQASAGRLKEVLLAASHNPAPAIRLRAAFALGIVGGGEAVARLTAMLGDPLPEVRFNAATGLARLGSAAGVGVLSEMLRYVSPAAIEQQTFVRLNALRALRRLADRGGAGANGELKALLPAISQLAGPQNPPEVRSAACALLVRLNRKPRSGGQSLRRDKAVPGQQLDRQ